MIFKSIPLIEMVDKKTEFVFLEQISIIEHVQPFNINYEPRLLTQGNIFNSQAISIILEIPKGGSRFSSSMDINLQNQPIIHSKKKQVDSSKKCKNKKYSIDEPEVNSG